MLADTTISKAGEVVDVTIASMLAEGAIGALTLGRTIFLLPFGLIAQTVNTVLLKELSGGMATQDAKFARRLMIGGINWTIFLLLPFGRDGHPRRAHRPRAPAVRPLRRRERPARRLAVKCYAVGLVGWGLVALSGRFFAARGQMGLGTLTNALALVVSVWLSLALVKTPFGFAGIALSSGITFTLAAVLRLALLNRSLREEEAAIRWADVWPTVFHTTLATSTAAIAAAMSLAAVRNFDAFPGARHVLNRVFQLGVPLFFGGFAFAGTAFLLESEQMDEILSRLQRGRGPAPDPKPPPPEAHPVVPQWLAPAALLSWVPGEPSDGRALQPEQARRPAPRSPGWQDRNVGAKLWGCSGCARTASASARWCRAASSRRSGIACSAPTSASRVRAAQRRRCARGLSAIRIGAPKTASSAPSGPLLGGAGRGGDRSAARAAPRDETRRGRPRDAAGDLPEGAASRPRPPRSGDRRSSRATTR